jgi:uncharacterized membrane protein
MSLELVVAIFENDVNKAAEAMKKLDHLTEARILHMEEGAIISKREDGSLEVQDVEDIHAKGGTIFGAITGGLIGLLGGPIGAVAGAVAGAVTGRVTANLADFGVSDDLIKSVEDGLQPGGSALIGYVQLEWAAAVIEELENTGAHVVHQPLKGDLAAGSA